MYSERADAGSVGRLHRALHRVAQKRLSDALALRAQRYCQARKQHDRHRMPRQSLAETLGRFLSRDLPDGEGVIADNDIPHQSDEGLRRSCLLVRPRESQQIAVEFRPAAVETPCSAESASR
jgi:hypothetical protein